jgi:uncharacterized metal-binding protein YceD (DUF177 family)
MPPDAESDSSRPEFSRPLALGRVGPAGLDLALEATAAECAALADRFGILGIASLQATLHLAPEADGAVLATGRLHAAVTQACVVSLDPVAKLVAETLAFRLLPAGREADEGPDEIDAIETEHDVADLGEVVAEALALALDPYPRAPAAELPPEATDAAAGAFAALAALRRKG